MAQSRKPGPGSWRIIEVVTDGTTRTSTSNDPDPAVNESRIQARFERLTAGPQAYRPLFAAMVKYTIAPQWTVVETWTRPATASQAAQENSGGQESDPLATHVAQDAEKGSTGVFSGVSDLEAWLDHQIEFGHAPDGYPVSMTPEYAFGRKTAFVAVLHKLRDELNRGIKS